MFLRSSAIFTFFTFVSRIFGFVRDLLIAACFGTTLYADAFAIAMKLPNFFRSIFAEGAFSAAFVPLFSGKLSAEGKSKALQFASNILGLLLFSLLILILLFEIFMPLIIIGLAPGFEGDTYKFNLTVLLTRITTPYLFFVSLVTFYSCILNSVGKFASMALSPIILNISMIVALYWIGRSEADTAFAASWAVFIGGLIQLAVIVFSTMKHKMWPRFTLPQLNSDVRRFFKNITPAILGSGITQINLWIGTIIATSVPGAVSVIYFVDRLVQLPISLIGVSIGIVILPSLSKSFKLKDHARAIHVQNRALEIALLLSLPCAVALISMAEPLIYILFQHGEFSANDTVRCTPALITLAIGIPAYVMNKIVIPVFFANEDTKTTMNISCLCLIINVTGNLILINYIAEVGITLTTAITAWINIFMLVICAYKKRIFKFDRTFKIKVLKIIAASAILYLFLAVACSFLKSHLYHHNLVSIAVLLLIILSSACLYFCTLYALKAYTLKELKTLI